MPNFPPERKIALMLEIMRHLKEREIINNQPPNSTVGPINGNSVVWWDVAHYFDSIMKADSEPVGVPNSYTRFYRILEENKQLFTALRGF